MGSNYPCDFCDSDSDMENVVQLQGQSALSKKKKKKKKQPVVMKAIKLAQGIGFDACVDLVYSDWDKNHKIDQKPDLDTYIEKLKQKLKQKQQQKENTQPHILTKQKNTKIAQP